MGRRIEMRLGLLVVVAEIIFETNWTPQIVFWFSYSMSRVLGMDRHTEMARWFLIIAGKWVLKRTGCHQSLYVSLIGCSVYQD